mmetsp:Transcript_1972/g.2437  ORF Transcript_1972/g.2437 Transcript_1972/m.2437 type:complete len:98 (-) Transcript_1972:23-316(-)
MTATHTAPLGFPENLFALLRNMGNFLAKGILALAIIFMAGLIAVATAAAGIALAAFALILRISGSNAGERNTRYEETAENGTVTLEAKKTPRGWTVE